jgi:hypothetical protein
VNIPPAQYDVDQAEPVSAARQHHVKHHQVGAKAVEHLFQALAVRTGIGVVAGVGQRLAHHFPDGLGVLDHQYPRRADAELVGLPGS